MCWGVETALVSQLVSKGGLFTTSLPTIGEVFNAHSTYCEGPMMLSPGDHRLLALPKDGFDLGAPPRKRLPLVLVASLEDMEVAEYEIINQVRLE